MAPVIDNIHFGTAHPQIFDNAFLRIEGSAGYKIRPVDPVLHFSKVLVFIVHVIDQKIQIIDRDKKFCFPALRQVIGFVIIAMPNIDVTRRVEEFMPFLYHAVRVTVAERGRVVGRGVKGQLFLTGIGLFYQRVPQVQTIRMKTGVRVPHFLAIEKNASRSFCHEIIF